MTSSLGVCGLKQIDTAFLEDDSGAISVVLPMGFELDLQVRWLKQLKENNGRSLVSLR